MGQTPPKYFLNQAPAGSSSSSNVLNPVQPQAVNPQTPLLPPGFSDPGTATAQQLNPFTPSRAAAPVAPAPAAPPTPNPAPAQRAPVKMQNPFQSTIGNRMARFRYFG